MSDAMRCVVFGASGGIGAELCGQLAAAGHTVLRFSRSGAPAIDLTIEADVLRAAELAGGELDRVIVASGFLHDADYAPEKTFRRLDPEQMVHSFFVNALGPALVLKHFAPLLAKKRKAVLAFLSARVGSIEDNRAGGWYSYRASKAALNQIMRTAAIELARTHPDGVCLSLHPGTVDTALSQPFHRDRSGLQSPAQSAAALLAVMESATPAQSGSFLDYAGQPIPF